MYVYKVEAFTSEIFGYETPFEFGRTYGRTIGGKEAILHPLGLDGRVMERLSSFVVLEGFEVGLSF